MCLVNMQLHYHPQLPFQPNLSKALLCPLFSVYSSHMQKNFYCYFAHHLPVSSRNFFSPFCMFQLLSLVWFCINHDFPLFLCIDTSSTLFFARLVFTTALFTHLHLPFFNLFNGTHSSLKVSIDSLNPFQARSILS